MEKEKKLEPIKLKKLKIRGDEIAILFFSLLFLIFLLISFFRLFAVGKLFDDFIFLFLFGWSKYLVYITLFAFTIPICFNYYFKLKFLLIIAITLSLIGISWLVSNINLILINNNDLWLKFSSYNFNNLNNYFNTWWSSTIINNYHGFFAQPIAFADWTNINSYFPSFAAGGIISNFLMTITNYGSFITNLILNFLLLVISFTWIFFNKPWFLFTTIFFFIKPLMNFIQKQKVKKISEKNKKSLPHENMILKTNAKMAQPPIKPTQEVKATEVAPAPEPIIEKTIEPKVTKPKPDKQQLSIQNALKESGTLTPFGQIKAKRDLTQKLEVMSESETEALN